MLLAFRPMDSVRCTAKYGCLDFLCQRFSSCFVTKPVRSETYEQNGCRVPTMVLSEAHGLSLFRVIREGLGSSKRLCARGAQGLTYPMQTRSLSRTTALQSGKLAGCDGTAHDDTAEHPAGANRWHRQHDKRPGAKLPSAETVRDTTPK